jgi:hypothetical protein
MTIYVDEMFDWPGKGKWCHMLSDSEDPEELHAFAAKIGLKRSWFHEGRLPHYDLRASKRGRALKLGAKPLSLQPLGEIFFARSIARVEVPKALEPEVP